MGNKVLHKQTKIRMSMGKTYAFVAVGTLMTTFASYYLIFVAELYTPGLGGIINGITFTTMDAFSITAAWFKPVMYWIIYGLANIPIIYFMLKWYSMKFFKLSLMQFVLSFTFMMFLTWVPGFGVPAEFTNLVTEARNGDPIAYFAIIFVSLLAGILYGVGSGLVFRVGACTMGLDPVVRYFTRERDKNIGPLLFAITIINTTTWTFIRYLINKESGAGFEDFIHGTFLNPSYVGSWIYIAVYSFTTGAIYASNKKAEIVVTSKKVDDISNYFNNHRFHRGHTLYVVEGGYSRQERRDFHMVINFEEMYDVIEKIASIDDEAFITVNELKKVIDVRNWAPVTDDDKEKAEKDAKREQERRQKLAEARTKREKDKK